MSFSRSLTIFIIPLTLIWGPVLADEQDDLARQKIIELYPELSATDIRPMPIDGLYEVRIGAQVSYITGDGRYLIEGDVYDVDTDENLTELRRTSVRLDSLEDVGESSMIIFEPEVVKHTITVFTDIDCGYCRKLHREIDGYNVLGIRVRYMFFPRSGPQTESWFKAENVWCSEDRNTALTQAKAGAVIESPGCEVTPVAQHYMLGKSFGIRGTPAIVADTGEMIGGYIAPQELFDYLNNQPGE
jgi:thiol:disulfide interchange protein DsbC